MIFGIGTDIVEVDRMRGSLERHGDAFARRILTDQEFEQFQQITHPAHFLAKRFAAKEAAAKALGTGFRDGLSLRHIGVVSTPQGQPQLVFTERAATLAAELGVGEAFLSLADERTHAIAFVTLLRR